MGKQLKPYDKYKETGLIWVEKVPSHWKLTRNKNLMNLKKELVGNEYDKFTLLSLTLNGIIARDMKNPKGKFPKDFTTYQSVEVDDLVFCLFDIDETPRTVGLSPINGMITGAYTTFSVVNNTNAKYLYYYYLSLDQNKLLKPLYTGLRKVISTDTFLRTKIPLPPRQEQDKIVEYLDFQLTKINKFILTKKKLISVLNEQKQVIINEVTTKGTNPNVKLKSSGIEWIEDIPVHWKTSQTKRIFREKNRPYKGGKETQLSLSQKDGLIPSENMTERSLQTSTYDNWKITLPGDLVLNRFKAHLGVFFTANLRGIVTFHYGVFEPIIELETKYYEYLFHCNAYKCIFAGRSNGMTVGLQNLSNQNFYNVYTIIPPLNEQKEIVAYIDRKHMEINKAISKIQKEIDLITEYKSSLISNVVTGQVDVREINVDLTLENEMHIEVLDEDAFEMEEVLEGEECEV